MTWNAIFLVVLGTLIGTESAYRDPLYEHNNEIESKMQDEDSFVQYLMEAIAHLGESVRVILIAVIAVSILSYSKGVFNLLVLQLCHMLMKS